MFAADRMNLRVSAIFFAVVLILAVLVSAFGKTVVEWDFRKGTQGWSGNKRVEALSYSPQGLIVKSTGEDPWIEGPAMDLPADKIIRVRIRMRSNADTAAELFYGRAFRAGRSVRFTARNDGRWHDYRLIVRDKLGPGTRFRLDPCMGGGEITVAFIKVEAISEIAVPVLEKPKEPGRIGQSRVSIKSGSLEFEHYGQKWGDFAFEVDGMKMAVGYESELIGLVFDEHPEWLNLKNAKVTFGHQPEHNEFTSRGFIKDSKGGVWEILKRIRPVKQQGTLIAEAELKVNKDRDVVHIPWLTIFPGLGTFGERKYQGLFAGLEYLCDEPSSSDADIDTPEHIRRVPDPLKITFPLMAIAHGGNYIGIIWEPSDIVAATFDSPDRIYNSGAHVMALSGPSVGELRFENDFSAHTPLRLEANKPLKISVLIIGGKGKAVVPAVKHYVELKRLPALPNMRFGETISHPARRRKPQCSLTGLPIIPKIKISVRDLKTPKARCLVKYRQDNLSPVVFRMQVFPQHHLSLGVLMNSCSKDVTEH
ncbi:MAG: hypothetical protein ACYS80_14715 [Planctomycetota bacterium]|jgi:hypothetical protein